MRNSLKGSGTKRRAGDFLLPSLVMLLSVYGIIIIASATRDEGYTRLLTQVFAVLLGNGCMIGISYLDYEYILYKRVVITIYIISIIALIITMIIGIGEGNRNWIRLKGIPFSIQTSEFVKLFFILTFAKHLDMVKDKINNILTVLSLLLHAGIIIGLIIYLGDLGSALIFICIALAMCYAQGLSLFYFLGGSVITVLASPHLWTFLKPYQQQRILVGFKPETDPLGYGYQQILSKRAITNGGLFGTGYMNSTIAPSVPYNHTDMIFSVMTEEFGLAGAIVMFILIILIVLKIIKIAYTARKDVGSLVCVGIAAMIIAQTIENIGMCLGLLPVVGITLPFMSYGGSSVLSLYMSIGVVMSVARFKNKYFFEREPS